MVFESIVASLLNRFVGEYIENLDASKLNLGIWGGDVVLNNLILKPTALDNLDLPIRLKAGYLAKLSLKIPWKNLYAEPVIAEIDGFYAVAVPNLGIKYDAKKEEKLAQDAKQAELAKIDEARIAKKKREANKGKTAEQLAAEDSFTEKMITQVIKNLQITINNIHVRYEDQFTNRKRPFALGFTLNKLFFKTTDQNWQPTFIKDAAVRMFFKLIELDSLSFYWNPKCKLISDLETREEMRDALIKNIATKTYTPDDLTYILAPICITAQMKLNQKPESDGSNYTIPKIQLNLSIQKLETNIGKHQYQDILLFLEAQERLTLNAKYRKYRPDLRDYKRHAKAWWRFAYTCILEENVRRRRRNWSWEMMREHRNLVKAYAKAYVEKLTVSSPPSATLAIIEKAEKQLNVFNLNIGRQQAEYEVEKKGLTRVEDQQGWVGWAGSFFTGKGSKAKPAAKKDENAISTQFENAMTSEEREKLYKALDYRENQPPAIYPEKFVQNKILFSLQQLAILVHDDLHHHERQQVMTITINVVTADVEQRPQAEAIRVNAKIRKILIQGIPEQSGKVPAIAESADPESITDENPQVLFYFETNPVNKTFDQFVKIRILAQNVIYHAPSINKLAVVFRPPESVRLKQLTSAAFAKYEGIKTRSVAGLQYALEKRTVLKLDIDLQPTCLQVYEGGVFDEKRSVLVVDFGSLKMITKDPGQLVMDAAFHKKEEKIKTAELLAHSYDKFNIELKNLQIIFASPRDDWQKARVSGRTGLHLLQPTGLEIQFDKASIVDLRLPQICITGKLPDLNINISDTRLVLLFKLLLSIPTPPPPPPGEVSTIEDIIFEEPDWRTKAKMAAIMEVNETEVVILEKDKTASRPGTPEPERKLSAKNKAQSTEQQVTVQMNLVLKQIKLEISRDLKDKETPYVHFGITDISLGYIMRPLDSKASISVHNVELEHKEFKSLDHKGPCYIIQKKPSDEDEDEHPLLAVNFVQCNKKSPFFASEFKMTETCLTVVGQPLNIVAHREAIFDVQRFATKLQAEIEKVRPPPPPPEPTGQTLAPPKRIRRSSSSRSNRSTSSSGKIKPPPSPLSELRKKRLMQQQKELEQEIINTMVKARFDGLTIYLGTAGTVVASVVTQGLNVALKMRLASMQAIVTLKSLTMDDCRPNQVGITRLMDVKDASPENKANFIDLNYGKGEDNVQRVNLNVLPFFFCIAPEFLGVLLSLASGPPEMKEATPPPPPVVKAQVLRRRPKKPKFVAPPPPPAPAEPVNMDVNVVIKNPEIVLVEDSTKPESTQAVMLYFDVNFNMKQQDEKMELNGGVTNLEIFSSYYDKKYRDQYKKHVLNPCTITAIQTAPNAGDKEIEIVFSDISLRISPSIIRILSGVAAGMALPQPEETDLEKSDRIVRRKHVWEVRPIAGTNFWYLNDVLPAEEADENMKLDDLPPEASKKTEQLTVSMPSFVFTLEADVGAGTVPMILLTSGFQLSVMNWSSSLEVDGSSTLEVSYYNEEYNVWEPLIEPLEGGGTFKPWELSLIVKSQSEFDTVEGEEVFLPPKMAITIISTDIMNVTISKTCLQMLQKLGEAFNQAAKKLKPTKTSTLELPCAFVVNNEIGLDIQVLPSETLELPPGKAGKNLPYSELVPLVEKKKIMSEEGLGRYRLNLTINVIDSTKKQEINVSRAEKRVFVLPKSDRNGNKWLLLADISSHYGRKLITLCSIVRIKNHLAVPMEVYYQVDTNLESAGIVDQGNEMNLPISAVYTESGSFFFKPRDDNFDVTRSSITWHEFSKKRSQVDKEKNKPRAAMNLCCNASATDSKLCFYFRAWVEKHKVQVENSNKIEKDIKSYTLHLRPPMIFYNTLPFTISITPPCPSETFELKSGESISFYNVSSGQTLLEVKILTSEEYMCRMLLEEPCEEFQVYTFSTQENNGKKLSLDLGVRTTTTQGSRDVSLYCPFWMVNKTGLTLTYKTELIYAPVIHPPDISAPRLFSFNREDFFKSKKASIKIDQSEWSDKFPIDIVGSAGSIVCKGSNGRNYNVSLTIQMAYSGLTKICTFTPYYLIDCRCSTEIEIREDGSDEWIKIPRRKCVPFWPMKAKKVITMFARYCDTMEESLPFPINQSFEAFVPVQNEYVGFDVSCHVSENSVVVELCDFQEGLAPALLVNHTRQNTVTYSQEGDDAWKELPPNSCVFFCWHNLTEKRILQWACGEAKNMKDTLYQDGTGAFNGDKGSIYWVSFLDGRQRVLLFTEDLAIATVAQAYEAERIDQQITCSLQGVGVSLVDNKRHAEIAFIAIMSSGVIWEFKKKRFKAMSIKHNQALEATYMKYNADKNAGKPVVARHKVEKLEVDFDMMQQIKPQECIIRRSFQAGLWLQYKTSPHQQHVHVKLNHFQIDNQLPVCVFPIVFSPVPPPKSVAAESIPKPFIEVSFVARKAEHSNIPQVKYFKVLVQEVALQADQGFINALLRFVGTDQITSHYTPELYLKDLAIVQQDLAIYALVTSSAEQKAFYDDLHFSPIKLHLSFSQGGDLEDSTGKKTIEIQSEFINLLLKSVGVTLTEIQDVVFKLDFFERKGVFLSRPKLIAEMTDHYTKQAIKQFYVLVLGLDIIGNPFGLIRDLSTGVESFFYEPIQGAVQGPEEFAEGLALGVKSLFGSAVGGAAGAVSRITGTLGKGLAALTMDDEYQRKRAEMMNRKPANAREGFMQGGRGLVSGVYEGVTGVFTKPIEGAKREGAKGFVKGVGKGLIGVVTRPVSGLVDFTSGTFDTVRRVTHATTEVKKLRPPRLMYADKILRPYVLTEAEGNQMLHSLAKGKYKRSDNYIARAPVTQDKKFYLIVTDKRILLASKNDMFGNFDVDWEFLWDEISEAPKWTDKGLKIKFKDDQEARKKKFGIFGKSSAGKLVHFDELQYGKEMVDKCKAAYIMQS